ncbi:hypothetical protein ABDK00_014205 [Niabella insulamsoli]|uniref:hypothetical protein n=1 Tax=Niabella insulamsoli TaxID=3144874 RepID=UPI0031FC6EB0
MSKKNLPPIHLACSDDELRPALQHVEIIDGIATATNAHILAQMNLRTYSTLPDECIRAMNGKLIHRDVWAEIIDADLIEVNDDILHYEKGGIKADVNIHCDLKFPEYDAIVKSVANSIFDRKSFVCFNPKYIQIAAKLFPSENLICRFYETNEMMIFFPSGEAKGYMGIMPLELSEDEATLDFSLI